MPNTREKLIELLQCSPTDVMGNHGVGALADHLIANGVTVQELDDCEYCKEDGEGFRKANGVFWLARPFHGGEWFIRAGNCKPRQIYFCPMCGRRLSQPPKGE